MWVTGFIQKTVDNLVSSGLKWSAVFWIKPVSHKIQKYVFLWNLYHSEPTYTLVCIFLLKHKISASYLQPQATLYEYTRHL